MVKGISEENKSLRRDLGFSWNKSVTYGIVETDPMIPTQLSSKRPKRAKAQTPILVIDCDLDVKKIREAEQDSDSRDLSVNMSIQKKHSQEILSSSLALSKRSRKVTSEKQASSKKKLSNSEVREKENSQKDAFVNKLPNKIPSFFSTRNSLSDSSHYFSAKPPLNKKKEHNACFSVQQIDNFNDLTQASPCHFSEKKAKTLFLDGTSSNEIIMNNSEVYRSMPSAELEAYIPPTVQPSKNSDFSFKMLYFKPIDDQQLNNYIKGVTESQYLKINDERDTSKTNDNHQDKTFERQYSISSHFAPSKSARKNKVYKATSNDDIDESNGSKHDIINVVKKTKSFKVKESIDNLDSITTNSYMKISSIEHNRSREDGQSIMEITNHRTSSPSLLTRKPIVSADKPKIKDLNVKIEAKSKTTYSKLDKLLQE